MDVERQLDRHKDSVYRQLVRTCHRREDAEDALVETLIAAFQSADRLNHPAALRSWLGTVADRVCHHIQRRDDLRRALSLDQIADSVSPEESVKGAEQMVLRKCLHDAVESLPKEMRRAYELCDLEDVSLQEAAAMEQVTVAAMKSRLHRARQRLRVTLDQSLCLSDESQAIPQPTGDQ